MFVAEALADFSNQIMKTSQSKQNQQSSSQKQEKEYHSQQKVNKQQDHDQQLQTTKKRARTQEHNQELLYVNNENDKQQNSQQQQKGNTQQTTIKYTQFIKGDKILVKETYQNGWWFGHPVGKPQVIGFFPSNFVKIGAKPPAPPPPKNKVQKQLDQQIPVFNPSEGIDFIKKQLDQLHSGPIKSDYYQGIKGYKMVKIDEKNQNILKGNHVQFDVATGLARVPVKDQAPTAKAVRQMGYYFDYHQWNETLNKNPQKKARPDPKKKKPKKLHLKMMD